MYCTVVYLYVVIQMTQFVHTYVRTNHVADKHSSNPTLPVVVVKRKTLVLDLDETLIHAQRDG